MHQGAVPAVGVAVPPMPAGMGYDAADVATRSLNFWGMMVMVTGILALLCSLFAGVPAIVAGSIILCECCRGGAYMTRSSAGTVITLSIIAAIISPAIFIIYLSLAIRYHTGAYVAPIIILLANTLSNAVLASRVRKHRYDLPEYATTMPLSPPEAMLVAPGPYGPTPGPYPMYPPGVGMPYGPPPPMQQGPVPAGYGQPGGPNGYGQPGVPNGQPYYGGPGSSFQPPPGKGNL